MPLQPPRAASAAAAVVRRNELAADQQPLVGGVVNVIGCRRVAGGELDGGLGVSRLFWTLLPGLACLARVAGERRSAPIAARAPAYLLPAAASCVVNCIHYKRPSARKSSAERLRCTTNRINKQQL